MDKHSIYCFNNGGSHEWYTAIAVADDGNVLASHTCSSEVFTPHDLGITSNWKHDKYNAHFGEGNWELIWVDDPKNDPRIDAALTLNKALSESAKQES